MSMDFSKIRLMLIYDILKIKNENIAKLWGPLSPRTFLINESVLKQ